MRVTDEDLRRQVTEAAARSVDHEYYALECALAMAWCCLDIPLSEMAQRVVVEHHERTPLRESRIVLGGRVIHRQWWEYTGHYQVELRQEWQPAC